MALYYHRLLIEVTVTTSNNRSRKPGKGLSTFRGWRLRNVRVIDLKGMDTKTILNDSDVQRIWYIEVIHLPTLLSRVTRRKSNDIIERYDINRTRFNFSFESYVVELAVTEGANQIFYNVLQFNLVRFQHFMTSLWLFMNYYSKSNSSHALQQVPNFLVDWLQNYWVTNKTK